MLFRIALAVCITVWLSGCNDKTVYAQCYDAQYKGTILQQVQLQTDDNQTLQTMRAFLTQKGISVALRDADVLEMMIYHVTSCENPRVKSIGSDFDGYVRLSFRHEGKEIYRCQQDFKGFLSERDKERLLQHWFKDLALKSRL